MSAKNILDQVKTINNTVDDLFSRADDIKNKMFSDLGSDVATSKQCIDDLYNYIFELIKTDTVGYITFSRVYNLLDQNGIPFESGTTEGAKQVLLAIGHGL